MARPRKDNPADAFTSTEMAIGAGIPPRSFALLQERYLAPDPVNPFAAKNATRLWNTNGLAQAALTGAFFNVGFELFPSARLSGLIFDELSPRYGSIPSNLQTYWQDRNFKSDYPEFPWCPSDMFHDVRDDFWLHHYLMKLTKAYTPRRHMRGDLCIEIADRQYVFLNGLRDFNIRSLNGTEVEPSYRIRGLERGGDAIILTIPDEVGLPYGHPDVSARYAEIEAEFLAARENAVGILTVNIALAIRNAFDAVHEHRLATGAQFDWSATIKPKPGRYDGCDADGWPLDPNHPSNRDLPPEERAKRRAEIKAYIDARDKEWNSDTS